MGLMELGRGETPVGGLESSLGTDMSRLNRCWSIEGPRRGSIKDDEFPTGDHIDIN